MFIVFYVYKQSVKPGEKQQNYFFSPNTPTVACEPWSGSPTSRIVLTAGGSARRELPWQKKLLVHFVAANVGCVQTKDTKSRRAHFTRAVVSASTPSVSISEQFLLGGRKFGLW